MRTLILALPQGDPGPTGPTDGGSGSSMIWIMLIPLLLIFVLMPLFNKKERQRRQRLTSLKKHDRVVTSGGIFGTITALDEGSVTIEIAKDVRIKVKRSSVFDIERPGDARTADQDAKKAGARG